MADKSINDLPKSASLTDDDSLPVYKSTEKKTERITVGQLKDVAKSAATGPAEEAANSADKAKVAAEIAKNAQQGAEKSLEQLNDQVELAQSAREGAENAKKSIEDMTVSAETLPPGFEATATKTIDENGVTNIKLGIPKGDTGEQGEPGVSPTVNVQKDGKITTITITDETGPNVATILDGEDGAGKVSSVNGQTGEVSITPKSIGAMTIIRTYSRVSFTDAAEQGVAKGMHSDVAALICPHLDRLHAAINAEPTKYSRGVHSFMTDVGGPEYGNTLFYASQISFGGMIFGYRTDNSAFVLYGLVHDVLGDYYTLVYLN